ncbi:hypothetical protein KJN74_01710 [Candidatus Bathyarchaeota archaeon]|nr:hypothetical protein [Candidatus Bathyarchaeota archaeon]
MSKDDKIIQSPTNDESKRKFSEEIVKKAFLRANCRCQCERDTHDHGTFTCFKQIKLEHRGNKNERSGWEANYFIRPEKGGKSTLENCDILCWSCYIKTIQGQ